MAKKPHSQTRGLKHFAPKPKERNHAVEQAAMQYAAIRGLVVAYGSSVGSAAEEGAMDAILSDPIEVSVRTGWYPATCKSGEPVEYRILLCTGGPAVQIVGTLGRRNEPETARLQYQDWGTPWIDWDGNCGEVERVLLAYARCFYFGE